MPMKVVGLPPPVSRDRLARLPQVENLTGLKKSSIYQRMREGKFPQAVRLSSRMVAWSENAVLQWVQDRLATAQTEGGQQ